MSSILTVTFNPAIDKSTSVSALIAEKKLKCTLPIYEPGGGGINVARAIKKLGGNAKAIYLAGGCTGKFLTELLEKELIESIVTQTKENTRENLSLLDEATNQQFRFNMPGLPIRKNEWEACLESIKNLNDIDFIVASGSLPLGVPLDIFARIAEIAKVKNSKLIVDTSGDALKEALNAGIYLIKPNLGELSILVGKEELNLEMVDDAARELIEKRNCEVVVVSLGAAGAMLVTKDLAMQIVPPVVKRKSTVGAGDSMVAGMILSLSHHKDLIESVQYGVACGTAATLNHGTELCKKEDADRLFQLIKKIY